MKDGVFLTKKTPTTIPFEMRLLSKSRMRHVEWFYLDRETDRLYYQMVQNSKS